MRCAHTAAAKALHKAASTTAAAAAAEEAPAAAPAHACDTAQKALVQHLQKTYPDDLQGKRVHRSWQRAAVAPPAINPYTGTFYCRTFAFLARQLRLTAHQFQETYALVYVFPMECPSPWTPRGCRADEVTVFVSGAPAKHVCERLTALEEGAIGVTVTEHFADHPECAIPSCIFRGVALTDAEHEARRAEGMEGAFNAFVRRAAKAEVTADGLQPRLTWTGAAPEQCSTRW
ncbi:hypothetical protein JKP88DRAFT_273755 [Tribonema minus]|uniref:Uncharacterized protein n=1 Tax=Tribonema minus TaxID=303371 RepID=A0A836CAE8_9STRA|nr:hypothetical protein JKP88DRAFT_273755 [Tribonema minus]